MFKKTLLEHGYSRTNVSGNIYHLAFKSDPERIITAQFILPEPVIESTYGCRGIHAIGNFRFRTPPPGVSDHDFYIFSFTNPCNCCIEFVIIPSPELKKRLKYRNRTISDDQETEIVFWLMQDKSLYNTTGLGAEGRYYLIDGRMADNTDLDYTSYLNNWEILSVK